MLLRLILLSRTNVWNLGVSTRKRALSAPVAVGAVVIVAVSDSIYSAGTGAVILVKLPDATISLSKRPPCCITTTTHSSSNFAVDSCFVHLFEQIFLFPEIPRPLGDIVAQENLR